MVVGLQSRVLNGAVTLSNSEQRIIKNNQNSLLYLLSWLLVADFQSIPRMPERIYPNDVGVRLEPARGNPDQMTLHVLMPRIKMFILRRTYCKY